jgi:RNase P subunit RPR2
MESDLECPLCTNEYSRDNVPRLLTSCGHTFCHSCLDTLIIEENNQFRLSCPEDEIVIYLKNN